MNPVNLVVLMDNIVTLQETIEYFVLVFPPPRYSVASAALKELKDMVLSEQTDIGRLIEYLQHIAGLLNNLSTVHNCAGCNYITTQFEQIVTAFMVEPQPTICAENNFQSVNN